MCPFICLTESCHLLEETVLRSYHCGCMLRRWWNWLYGIHAISSGSISDFWSHCGCPSGLMVERRADYGCWVVGIIMKADGSHWMVEHSCDQPRCFMKERIVPLCLSFMRRCQKQTPSAFLLLLFTFTGLYCLLFLLAWDGRGRQLCTYKFLNIWREDKGTKVTGANYWKANHSGWTSRNFPISDRRPFLESMSSTLPIRGQTPFWNLRLTVRFLKSTGWRTQTPEEKGRFHQHCWSASWEKPSDTVPGWGWIDKGG